MRVSIFVAFCLMEVSAIAPLAQADELRIPALIKLIDEAEIPALEAGVVDAMTVSEGAKVEAGQVLLKLSDRDAQLFCDRQRADYEVAHKQAADRTKIHSAEASLKVAEAELQRARDARMRLGDAVSDTELDRLDLMVTHGRLAIEQAKHEVAVFTLQAELKQRELAIAEQKLKRHFIAAPFAGVVAQVFIRRGEWVEPGEKVLRLVRTDRLKAEGFAVSDKIQPAHQGSRVLLSLASGGATSPVYAGKLVFVSPETDPINGQVRLVAEIENESGALRPGMKGTLTILGKP
jgi:RND family efflux transporter MFP subunit